MGRRSDFEYDVFISYRSIDGRAAASWLSRKLRAYRAPRSFGKTLEGLRVYRDNERERVTPAIWEDRIQPTLKRSRFLLVVLTPSVLNQLADGSPNWVTREVTEFLKLPQSFNLMLARAGGPPDLPIPKEIAGQFPEPGWVDIRAVRQWWTRIYRRSSLRDKLTALAVPALDISDHDIPIFNQLAERDKRRTAWMIAGVATGLLGIMAALAFEAVVQRNVAIVEALIAQSRRFTAQARAEFANNPIRALLLAREGVEVSRRANQPVPAEADQSLVDMLLSVGGQSLAGHERGAFKVAVAPNSRWLITAGLHDDEVLVWDLSSKDPTARPYYKLRHPQGVAYFDLSLDGRWLVTAGYSSGVIRLWDLLSADPRDHPLRLDFRKSPLVSSIRFSRDSSVVLAGHYDGFCFWTVPTPKSYGMDSIGCTEVRHPFDEVSRLVSAKVDEIASTKSDRRIITTDWRALEWTLILDALSSPRVIADASIGTFRNLVVAGDDRFLVSGGFDGKLRLWPLDGDGGQAAVIRTGHTGEIRDVKTSSDGRWVASASADRTIRVWDFGALLPVDAAAALHGHEGGVNAVAFDRTGRWLISGSDDSTVRAWDLHAADPSMTAVVFRGIEGRVSSVAISNDGKWVAATGHGARAARLWGFDGPRTNSFTFETPQDLEADLSKSICVADDVLVRRVSTGKRLSPFVTHSAMSRSDLRRDYFQTSGEVLRGPSFILPNCKLTPDGRVLVVADDVGNVAVWSGGWRSIQASTTGAETKWNRVGIDLSDDARWLVWSGAGLVRVWDLSVRDPFPRPYDLRMQVSPTTTGKSERPRVAISSSGSWVMAGSEKRVYLWQLFDGRVARSHVFQAEATVDGVEFSRDGRWAIVQTRREVLLWDLWAAGLDLAPLTLRGHAEDGFGSRIFGMASNSQRRWLATAGADGTVRLWDLGARNPTERSRILAGHSRSVPVISVSFSSDGRWLASSNQDEIVVWNVDAVDATEARVVIRAAEMTEVWVTSNRRWVIARDREGKLTLWPLSFESMSERARSVAGRDLSGEERRMYHVP